MPEVLQIVVLVYTGFLSTFHFYRWLNPVVVKIVVSEDDPLKSERVQVRI